MSIMCLTIFSLVYLATFIGASYGLEERDSCATGYTLCSPPGASTTVTPQIGDSAFPNLFADIVHSSLPASKRSLSERQTASLCCIASLDCLTMSGLSLPFCYDRFTTNYFLPDGSLYVTFHFLHLKHGRGKKTLYFFSYLTISCALMSHDIKDKHC